MKNLVEFLKDCPKGMELDCTSYDNVSFDKISEDKKANYPIFCYITDEKGNRNSISFTEYGCESERYGAKCVIFPKGKTTWEGFHRPFKDGDIVAYDNPYRSNLQLFIFKDKKEGNTCSDCYLMLDGDELDLEEGMYYITRLATEEEKQILFDAIKANGYKWNTETKTLEKLPKFKVGDRIKYIYLDRKVAKVVKIHDKKYELDNGKFIEFQDENAYEISYDKFDITTLKPFESKVLVRDYDNRMWIPTFWGKHLGDDFKCSYLTTNGCYKYCIPYEGNQHLLGTTNDCDDFYKTWKKKTRI